MKERDVGDFGLPIFFLLLLTVIVALVACWNMRSKTGDRHGASVTRGSMETKAISVFPVFPEPQKEVASTIFTYVIKRGDTLTRLAKRTCDTPEAIAQRNGLTLSSVIYTEKTLQLQQVEQCSPESVKVKTFPEKFPSRHHAGAPQEKSFIPQSGVAVATPFILAPGASFVDCALVGSRLRDFDHRVRARAECIRQQYGHFIARALATVDPRLTAAEVVAVMIHESQGNPRAVSPAKDPCFGLMQLQGGTARTYGVRDVFDPQQNITGGVRVLSDYTFRHAKGDRARGLAFYNMGPFHRLLKDPQVGASRFSYVREVMRIERVLTEAQFFL